MGGAVVSLPAQLYVIHMSPDQTRNLIILKTRREWKMEAGPRAGKRGLEQAHSGVQRGKLLRH